jgi:hypothetical protein
MGREERPLTSASTGSNRSDITDDEYASVVEARLLDGERVLASLDLREGLQIPHAVTPDSLVLTESRVVYVSVGGHENVTSVVAVRDVAVATVESERHGPSAYVWGVLAIILGFLLSQVIDNQVGSIVAGLAVAAMGVYLIADKIWSPVVSAVIVVPSKENGLRCELRGRRAKTDVYEFIASVYARKEEIATGEASAGSELDAIRRPGRYAAAVSRASGRSPRPRGRE